MGETQEILVDVTVLSLFVLFFATMLRRKRDDRLRCWLAGWISIVAHFAANLWQPVSPGMQTVQACLSADALALAAICFVLSTMIVGEGRRMARRLFLFLAVSTLICIDAAIAGMPGVWGLALLVVIRQAVALHLALRPRRDRRRTVAALIGGICMLSGLWMIYGVLHGQPDVVIAALLGEMYLVTAIDFWLNGMQHTTALKGMIGGLVAWGAVFPVGYLASRLWPHLQVDREVWNVPKFCVALSMILVVMEEDTRAARALNEDYRLLFESNPEALWIVDTEMLCFLAVNQTALDLHGYTREEFLQLKLTDVVHPSAQEQVLDRVRRRVLGPHRAKPHVRKDGSILHLDVNAFDITFEGRPCRFVMAVDATSREALELELNQKTTLDQLTGLPSRKSFPEMLAKAVQHALVEGEKFAVISLDFDRFKRVNDTYGLRAGDEFIQRVAQILKVRLRSMDIIARTAGDEFTIVLTGLKSAESVEQTVNELLQVFSEPMLVQGYRIQRPVCLGVALGPDSGEDANALWSGAERARNHAKATGGGRAVWLSAELDQGAKEQVEIERYIRSNLEDGGFSLQYQPLYGMDGMVHGLEALLRLKHPALGAVSPLRVIPVAEESGLILQLGQWVIEEVCRQLLAWKAQGMALVPVSVNASGLQIMHEDFAQRLMATLDRYGIAPQLIHIEVTESVAMRNMTDVTERIATLSAMGISFSIDDFGTGYSSMARLSELGTSELKIDRSFMQPACGDSAHSIVQAIITLGHAMGHTVVAEGVETDAQIACLRELHCDLLQGFFLSRPVTPEKVPALVSAPHPALAQQPMSVRHDRPLLAAQACD